MLFPFFFASPKLPPPIYHMFPLYLGKKINQLPLSQKCQKQGHQKEFDFLTALCDSHPLIARCRFFLNCLWAAPAEGERGREGPREGQRGAKAGHADPSESSGHYYSPPMIQAVINHRHQLPVWPVFQCEKLLTLTITWCKGKPLSKNLKAKLHLHLRLQLPCLRWHQTHESDLFSHLFL